MEASEFKRIFVPFGNKLYRIAYAITGSREDAEDMVQEAYLRLWHKRDDLSGADNLEALSVTVVKNLCLNLLRNRSRIETSDDLYSPVLVSETDVGRDIESRDAAAVLSRLMERLPAKQLEVIRMRDIADCSIEEIESCTGLSPTNIRAILSRTRKKLKQQFTAIMNYQRHE